jgi:hypothetical protein
VKAAAGDFRSERMDVNTQSLFAPHNRTATSIAAARATDRSGRAEPGRMKILRLCNAPHWREHGITQEEICELLDIKIQTCNPRVNELVHELGYLKEIGTRKISTGRTANVYAITPAGVESLGS